MKKVTTLLFVGTMLTFAACQSKPKTEEGTVETTADTTAMMADTTTMMADSTAKMATDSASTMTADSAK